MAWHTPNAMGVCHGRSHRFFMVGAHGIRWHGTEFKGVKDALNLLQQPWWWFTDLLCMGKDHYQCGQIWHNFATLAKFQKLSSFFKGLFSVWHNFEPSLANFLCYWANFHCCKRQNI